MKILNQKLLVWALANTLYRNERGSVAIIFALVLAVLLAAGGSGLEFARVLSAKASMQGATDAAALLIITELDDHDTAIESATVWFEENYNTDSTRTHALQVDYDKENARATVSATGEMDTALLSLMGVDTLSVSTSSTAIRAGRQYQVCILITAVDENHVLLGKNEAKIDFHNCLVQVDTLNWDAVEMRDTSYMHSTDGQNCFVGDIHYGDVQPGKSPTCEFFGDPFVDYRVPDTECDFENHVVNSQSTLQPGTYCKGLVINASTTFAPGLYTIRDGKFHVLGSGTDIEALGVTFLIAGDNASFEFNTTGTIDMSPASAGDAGKFDGFAIFVGELEGGGGAVGKGKGKGKGKNDGSLIMKATVNAEGIFYLPRQKFLIENQADVTITPGSIISYELLPKNAALELTGTLENVSDALSLLQKQGHGDLPTLIN
ncbi:MAG: Flp pilus assembly protein TadG [Gammaproteobacteria bacterium]|jgi:Flp pilus assembly protein TadG